MAIHLSMNSLTKRLIRTIGDKIARTSTGKGRFCVVNYHRILESPDSLLDAEPDTKMFRSQMEVLKECFNVLPLHDAISALGTQYMPPRAVCITFDDGYRSTHDLALPILRELGLPATVFVTSGYVGENNMWNDTIVDTLRSLPNGKLDLREFRLGVYTLTNNNERKRAIRKLTEAAKYLPPTDRLSLTRKLEELSETIPSLSHMLTRDMVVNLVRQGIEIGAHTITHPILKSLADASARQEITACKQELEALTGKPVRLFAYPNGKAGIDFDERHVQMAKDAGYAAAFTTAIGAATHQHDRFRFPRSRPWDAAPLLYGLRLLRWLGSSTA